MQPITESLLRDALEEGRFEAVFQPIVRLGDRALAGFEALARLRLAGRDMLIAPDRFLAEAIEADLLGEISLAVMREAVRWMAGARTRHPAAESLFLAVNVPGPDLSSTALAETLGEAAGLMPPSAVRLEITEHHVLPDLAASRVAIERFRDMGFTVAIDDFGAGAASLLWLLELPLATMKIDRALVTAMAEGGAGAKIVAAMVDLAHALGLTVVAEGIESLGDADRATEVGCDYGQGFAFAPAMPAEAAEALISAQALPWAPVN